MVAVQSTDEILGLLDRLVGEAIAELQVLGINNLKSVTPSPSEVVGSKVLDASLVDRTLTIEAGAFFLTFDLQRTGRLEWLDAAAPARIGQPGLPTVRLLLESGSG